MASSKRTPPKAPADLALVNLRAVEPILADGQDYAPGDELALGADAAADLLASGAAELA